jgi:probable phosphoglycerate mutase
VTTVLLVRHGLTATTGQVLTGWTPGIGLDQRGRDQAKALADRLSPIPLAAIVTNPLWPVVQAHPSAVRFPGRGGESMLDMQHRAVTAVREWNARLGKDATYLICSHGDVIKAIVADSLGLHLDQSQRIVADPCSLTVIRYTPLRPFLIRLNDVGGGVDDLLPRVPDPARDNVGSESDAVIGGGAGSSGSAGSASDALVGGSAGGAGG